MNRSTPTSKCQQRTPIITLMFGAVASVILLFVLPEKELKVDEFVIDLVYLLACLYAYVYVAKTTNFAITFGWSLFCVSLMLDSADEVVSFKGPGSKTLEDIVSFIGVMFFAYGCKRNADQLKSALQHEQDRTHQLSEVAYIDPLTQLPNRAELLNIIESWLARQQPFSVYMIDLNGFKPVNDQHGHHTGDALLQQVAERLRNQIRSSDFIARLGGDEFILLQGGAGDDSKTTPFAAKIHASFAEPFMVDEQPFHLGASIGIAHYPKDGDKAAQLFSHADNAMYQSKHQQSGPVHYRPD